MSPIQKRAPMAALRLEALAREVAARKDALLAAFCVESGLPPGRVALRERRTPLLAASWAEAAPAGRRSWRRWLADLGWRLLPWRRRHVRARAAAFHALGLKAEGTVLFEEYGGAAPTCYYAERRRLQVTCNLCRKRVALDDWQHHVEKVHAGLGLENV